MRFELDKRFKQRMKGKIEEYHFQVGILEDKPHKFPLSYRIHGHKAGKAGLPGRKTSGKNSYATMKDVSESMREKHNYLLRPWRMKTNVDILNLLRVFFGVIKGNTQPIRLRNTVQAVVRNPILRLDYGSNTQQTIGNKGFNAPMLDTWQFFNNIKASVYKLGRKIV